MTHQAGAYPGYHFYSLDGMLDHRRDTPSVVSLPVPIYIPPWREAP